MIYKLLSCVVQINDETYSAEIGYGGYLIAKLPSGRTERVHRLVAAAMLNRPLLSSEHIHHIDGNKLNNSPENLQVVTSSEHSKLHTAVQNPAVELEIARLIANEDKTKPLGDHQLIRILNANGFDIARRTVSKYRLNLGIPASSKRRINK